MSSMKDVEWLGRIMPRKMQPCIACVHRRRVGNTVNRRLEGSPKEARVYYNSLVIGISEKTGTGER